MRRRRQFSKREFGSWQEFRAAEKEFKEKPWLRVDQQHQSLQIHHHNEFEASKTMYGILSLESGEIEKIYTTLGPAKSTCTGWNNTQQRYVVVELTTECIAVHRRPENNQEWDEYIEFQRKKYD